MYVQFVICKCTWGSLFFLILLLIKNIRAEIISWCFRPELKDKIRSIGSTLSLSHDNHQRWRTHIIQSDVKYMCRNRSVAKGRKKERKKNIYTTHLDDLFSSELVRSTFTIDEKKKKRETRERESARKREKEREREKKKRRARRGNFDKSLVRHTLCSCDMLAEKKKQFVCHC